MAYDEYSDYEGENDKCVDSLSNAFVYISEAVKHISDSGLEEHEEAVNFLFEIRGLIIDCLSLCREVEKEILNEMEKRRLEKSKEKENNQ